MGLAERKENRAFFLDRDDTIIYDYGYLNSVDQVHLLEGVPEALKSLQDQGFLLIVVTNQSGLTRGLVDIGTLDAIHQKISELLLPYGVRIKAYYSAPYKHPHHRRKPGAGLIKEAALDWGVNLSRSWMAGDKWRDLQAGKSVGCKTLLVNTAPGQDKLFKDFQPDISINNWTTFLKEDGIFQDFLKADRDLNAHKPA